MPALAIAVLTFIASLASGMAGLALAQTLPLTHTAGRSRAMVAGATALTGLLLVAVLGLSIGNACGFMQREKAALSRLAADALEFDLAARRLGPQGAPARRLMSAELAMIQTGMRGAAPAEAGSVGVIAANIAAMNAALDGLTPADDPGKRALAEAARRYGEFGGARLTMALPPADPISLPLVMAMLAWSCLTFCGLGALSRRNATTAAAMALGGLTVASAIWLSIVLSEPLTGAFRLSPAPIEHILVEIAQ